jgi:serine/threonine protein kinase
VRTPSSDLWSLGVVLYEMLTGLHPFRDATLAATRKRILAGRYAPLAIVRPECDRETCELVSALLSTDVDCRPTSAAEVAAILRARATARKDGAPVWLENRGASFQV